MYKTSELYSAIILPPASETAHCKSLGAVEDMASLHLVIFKNHYHYFFLSCTEHLSNSSRTSFYLLNAL